MSPAVWERLTDALEALARRVTVLERIAWTGGGIALGITSTVGLLGGLHQL